MMKKNVNAEFMLSHESEDLDGDSEYGQEVMDKLEKNPIGLLRDFR